MIIKNKNFSKKTFIVAEVEIIMKDVLKQQKNSFEKLLNAVPML